MPSRVYHVVNATLVDNTIGGNLRVHGINTPASNYFTFPSVGRLEMLVNETDTDLAGAFAEVRFTALTIEMSFSLDYDQFPSIPDSAKIKKLVWNRPATINVSAIISSTNMTVRGMGSGVDPPFDVENVIDVANSYLRNESLIGTPADVILFNREGTDTFLTKAELISSWSIFTYKPLIFPINGAFYSVINGVNPSDNVASLIASMSVGNGWSVTVTWEDGFQWSVSQDTAPVEEDSVITIISDPADVEAVDMDDITQIDIVYPDPADPTTFITVNVPVFTIIDSNNLIFPFPALADEPLFVSVVITSAQFSGSMAKQLYTTFLVSAPGIYKFIPGQRFDTLYDRTDPDNIVTVDIKIPNPFIKTGPING